jgi:ABC-type lipoprotein release transport system permease subunit
MPCSVDVSRRGQSGCPSDPGALVGVLLLLGSVAALAAYGPARRASSLSPTITLKEE